ncbi:MAG: ATP-binding protein [Candidatus Xenobia bacterium]
MTVEAQPAAAGAGVAFRDELTGLYNRRFWGKQFPIYATWSQQHHSPLSLALIDIDELKLVNDTLGYSEGNALLVQVAQLLRDYKGEGALPREYCLPIRYAGDKFCVLMPGVPRAAATRFLLNLTSSIRINKFSLSGPAPRVTVSIGLATCPTDTRDPQQLMHMAENALQAAIKAGRDRVCTPSDIARLALDKESLHLLFPSSLPFGRDPLLLRARQLIGPTAVTKPVMVIHGCLGAGKSRVLGELHRLAQPDLCQGVFCRSLPFLMPQPFGVLVEALQSITGRDPRVREQMLSRLDAAQKGVLNQFLPEWARHTVLDYFPQTATPGNPLDLLEDVFAQMLLGVTEKPMTRQLVLLFDDAQWLDLHTLRVIEKVKGRRGGNDVMVLMAVRSHDETASANLPLQRFLESLSARDELEMHALEPLSREQIADWMHAVLPGLSLPTEVIDLVHHRSLGLPLLVQEIVKFLIHADYITIQDDRLHLDLVHESDIPANLSDLLFCRTQNLDEELLGLMSRAAVLGPVFDLETLAAVCPELGEGHVIDLLDMAARLGLIHEEAHGLYAFMSQGAYDSFYASLPPQDRRRLHAGVAALVEEQHLTPDGISAVAAARVAFHWQAAGVPDRAVAILQSILMPAAAPKQTVPARPPPPAFGEEQPLPPEETAMAVRLLRSLKSAVQNHKAFPPHSEVVGESQRQVLAELQELHGFTQVLTISVTETALLVNGRELPSPHGVQKPSHDLGAFLVGCGLFGLSVRRGVQLSEIRTLIELMARHREDIQQEGGWDSLLKLGGAENIRSNERVYVSLPQHVTSTPHTRARLSSENATLHRLPVPGDELRQRVRDEMMMMVLQLEQITTPSLNPIEVDQVEIALNRLQESFDALTRALKGPV